MIVQLPYTENVLRKLNLERPLIFQQQKKPTWLKLEEVLVLSGYKEHVEVRERADISKREMDYLHNKLGEFFLKNKISEIKCVGL